MSFELHVEFTGLCAHVYDQRTPDRATVLMVNAHDGRHGRIHAGYVRIDLANIPLSREQPPVPTCAVATGGTAPVFDVVYQVDRQQLDFGLEPTGVPMSVSNGLPDVDRFSSILQLRPGTLDAKPIPEVLFRTVLPGGNVTSDDDDADWEIEGTLNPPTNQPLYGKFPGAVRWKRDVPDRDDLTLTFTNFDDGSTQTLRLVPVELPDNRRVISLKIANLCQDNVLEWGVFGFHDVTQDVDFRWLYRLLELKVGVRATMPTSDSRLPIPTRTSFGPHDDCFGLQVHLA